MEPSKSSRRPTLIDIAKQANVSTWTVSHALRGGKSVGPETRTRILQIASDLGYRPNQAARALVSSRTNMVAIWMQAGTGNFSPYYARLQHCLQIAAREHGYRCFVEDVVDHGLNLEPAHLTNWSVDGLILSDLSDGKALRRSIDPHGLLPVVSIGSWGLDYSVDHVALDLYPGSVDAVRHLIASGCKRIAYVAPMPFDVRFDAYAGVVREAGRREECIILKHNSSRPSVKEALRDHIRARGLPDGLFCENDDAAIACYRTLCEMGIRVPGDVRLVGCDGLEETEYLPTQLSTIVTPMKELASIALQFLINRINDSTIPLQEHTITPRLEIRASSAG